MMKGIGDKKGLDDFVARMAAGKGKASMARTAGTKTPRTATQKTPGVSSNAPPNPVMVDKGAKPTKVKHPKTKLPEPMASSGGVHTGTPTEATKASIVHNHYYSK